ncbi:MAG: aromatic acid exporter family protein [Neobacillus sp.]
MILSIWGHNKNGGDFITFGPRIFKTGLAVSLSIYICSLFNLELSIFAGVAAILAIQPSIYRSWKQISDQFFANIIGAAISLFFVYFIGENPLTIGIVIMLVIAISIKLKMEGTIPLTLVTVLAVMSAAWHEDWFFALDRLIVILIGTIVATLINVLIFPPKYKESFIEQVEKIFQNMSLLIRTSVSDELTEVSYQELNKKFKKDMRKIEEQYQLFDEERMKLGKSNQLAARELILLKQLLKTLQEGEQLLDTIDDHFFQSKLTEEENKIFDEQLEHLIKYHEYLLLSYKGIVKENVGNENFKLSKELYQIQGRLYEDHEDSNVRLLIIISSIMDYSFHLQRLSKLINHMK